MRVPLPHLEPIRFAQDLIHVSQDSCEVSASFPYAPSLAMLVEAAAQSSAGFASKDEETPILAFLVMLKNISLKQKAQRKECVMCLKVEQSLGDIRYFSFEAKEEETLVATGSFAIAFSAKG